MSSDAEEYKQYVSKVLELSKMQEAVKVDDEVIEGLVENKQVFSTKQYTHNIMSISELMAKSKANTSQNEEDSVPEVEAPPVPKINLDEMTDVDLDIDLGILDDEIATDEDTDEFQENTTVESLDENVDMEEVDDLSKDEDEDVEQEDNDENSDEDVELDFEIEDAVTDLEGMLFETADISLEKVNKKKTDEPVTKSKRIDLKNVSNLLMQLSSKPTKGKDVNAIKVPTYIKEMVPEFFKILDNTDATLSIAGVSQKQAKVSIELVDVNTDKRYMDKDAMITYASGQSNIYIVTSALENVNYEELDIARIIKLSENCYHIEIVPATCEEYNLWNKLCTQNFRGSSRTYGLM